MHKNVRLIATLLFSLMSLSASANTAYGEEHSDVQPFRLIGAFSQGRLDAWDTHGFNGKTEYRLIEDEGRKVLQANCSDSASGLVRNEKISLSESPVLQWSWRVDDVYEGIDETTRGGDDYPASLYVAVKTGFTMLSVRALHYVWSSNQPQGSDWDSAYTDNVKQIAVRSAHVANKGEWYNEARNVKEDFKRYFDLDVDHLDSISLMTDCDNSDSRAQAFYGDILFTPTTELWLGLDNPETKIE